MGIKTLSKDYPTKVSHKSRKIIAKAGDKVKVIAWHVDVAIVELTNKERISVHEKYLQ